MQEAIREVIDKGRSIKLTKRDIAKFWHFVKKSEDENGCWIWTRPKASGGYGRIRIDGETIFAHRLSYHLNVAQIPDGTMILHECDNPACVRPDHLKIGDHLSNMMDRQNRGRTKNGALDAEKVKQIRHRYENEFVTQKSLGDEYGVCQDMVRKIVNRTAWRHVP